MAGGTTSAQLERKLQTVDKARRRLMRQSSGECVQGVKTPEGELPEGQEKLAWAMHVQSGWIFQLFQS